MFILVRPILKFCSLSSGLHDGHTILASSLPEVMNARGGEVETKSGKDWTVDSRLCHRADTKFGCKTSILALN